MKSLVMHRIGTFSSDLPFGIILHQVRGKAWENIRELVNAAARELAVSNVRNLVDDLVMIQTSSNVTSRVNDIFATKRGQG